MPAILSGISILTPYARFTIFLMVLEMGIYASTAQAGPSGPSKRTPLSTNPV